MTLSPRDTERARACALLSRKDPIIIIIKKGILTIQFQTKWVTLYRRCPSPRLFLCRREGTSIAFAVADAFFDLWGETGADNFIRLVLIDICWSIGRTDDGVVARLAWEPVA